MDLSGGETHPVETGEPELIGFANDSTDWIPVGVYRVMDAGPE